jgi:hypothetical protein
VDAASLLPKGSFLFPAMVFWYRLLDGVRIQRQHSVLPRIRALVQHDWSFPSSRRMLVSGFVELIRALGATDKAHGLLLVERRVSI